MARIVSAHPSETTLREIENVFTQFGYTPTQIQVTTDEKVPGVHAKIGVVNVEVSSRTLRDRAESWLRAQGFDALGKTYPEARRPIRVLGQDGPREHHRPAQVPPGFR